MLISLDMFTATIFMQTARLDVAYTLKKGNQCAEYLSDLLR